MSIGPFTTSMALSNSAVTSGEPVTITITLKNGGTTADTIADTHKRVPGMSSAIGGNSTLTGSTLVGSGTNSGVTTFSYQEVFNTGPSTMPGQCATFSPECVVDTGSGLSLAISGPVVTVQAPPLTLPDVARRTQVGMLDYSSNIFSGLASVMGAW